MKAEEWIEQRGLPFALAFALGVLAMDVVRGHLEFDRTEALVVHRVEAALSGCMPKEQIGAKAILAWQNDGQLHCTKFEDFYFRKPTRTAAVVPVLSMPIAAEGRDD